MQNPFQLRSLSAAIANAPSGPASGTAGVTVFCPDGSQLAPGVVGLGVNLLADAYSDNGNQTAAGANIQMNGVTATLNP